MPWESVAHSKHGATGISTEVASTNRFATNGVVPASLRPVKFGGNMETRMVSLRSFAFACCLSAGMLALMAASAEAQVVTRARAHAPGALLMQFQQQLAASQVEPQTESSRALPPHLVASTGGPGRGPVDVSDLIATTGTRGFTGALPFGPPCDITCTGTAESEVCGTTTNGGCNDFCGTAFVPAAPGQTFCGTAFANGGTRDTDWYQLTLATVTELDLTLNAEFPSTMTLFEMGAAPGDCALLFALATVNGDPCVPTTLNRTVVAGTYVVVVTVGDAAGGIFDGFPCATGPGNQNDYQLDIDGAATAGCLTCAGGTPELEACGTSTNSGCSAAMAPFTFEAIVPATDNCGTAFNNGATRDVDWWGPIVVAAPTDLTVTFSAEFPGIAFLVRDAAPLTPCTNLLIVGDDILSGGCNPAVSTTQVGAGTYYIFVSTGDEFGPLFTGVACADAAAYQLRVDLAPAACPTTCTLASCAGTPEGEGCPANPNDDDNFNGGCNATMAGAYSDISTSFPGTASFCGVAWADSGTRDTDWWLMTLGPQNLDITVTVTSEFPVAIFLLADETVPGSVGGFPCDFATLDVLAAATGATSNPGNCTTVSTLTATLTPNPGAGTSNYVLFVGAANAAGPLFAGAPCNCDFNYSMTIDVQNTTSCLPPTGTCEANCATGEIDIALTAGSAYTSIDVEIEDLFGNPVTTSTIPGPITAGQNINHSVAVANGNYALTIIANCSGSVEAPAVVCGAFVYRYTGQTDLIFAGEFDDGCIDSVAALDAALIANGRSTLVIDNQFVLISDYDCIASAGVETVWVVLGSFPNNVALTATEGTRLQNLVLVDNISVYVESGDTWGFDPATDFANVDGVDNDVVIGDGDDSLLSMMGVVSPIDTLSLGNPVAYNQDNQSTAQFGGNDFTDQLVADTVGGTDDLPAGSTHSVIFTQVGVGYAVAIASQGPDDTTGRVIVSSFEFGGFGGTQNALAAAYLGFLKSGTPTTPQFVRGNCNGLDSSVNIADGIYLLGFLFPGANPPNVLNCRDACDANDDGQLNIADVIRLLNSLFGSPTVPLPLPNAISGCGDDPTDTDALDCVTATPPC